MTIDTHEAFALLTEMEMQRMDDSDDPEIDRLEERHLRVLDALYHNAGVVASEDLSPPTPDEVAGEAALAVFVERLTASPRTVVPSADSELPRCS